MSGQEPDRVMADILAAVGEVANDPADNISVFINLSVLCHYFLIKQPFLFISKSQKVHVSYRETTKPGDICKKSGFIIIDIIIYLIS